MEAQKISTEDKQAPKLQNPNLPSNPYALKMQSTAPAASNSKKSTTTKATTSKKVVFKLEESESEDEEPGAVKNPYKTNNKGQSGKVPNLFDFDYSQQSKKKSVVQAETKPEVASENQFSFDFNFDSTAAAVNARPSMPVIPNKRNQQDLMFDVA